MRRELYVLILKKNRCSICIDQEQVPAIFICSLSCWRFRHQFVNALRRDPLLCTSFIPSTHFAGALFLCHRHIYIYSFIFSILPSAYWNYPHFSCRLWAQGTWGHRVVVDGLPQLFIILALHQGCFHLHPSARSVAPPTTARAPSSQGQRQIGFLFAHQDCFLALLSGRWAGQLSCVRASPAVLPAAPWSKPGSSNVMSSSWTIQLLVCRSACELCHSAAQTHPRSLAYATLSKLQSLAMVSWIGVERQSLNINKIVCGAPGRQGWAQYSAIGLHQFGKILDFNGLM